MSFLLSTLLVGLVVTIALHAYILLVRRRNSLYWTCSEWHVWERNWAKSDYLVLLLGGVGIISLATSIDVKIRNNQLSDTLARARFMTTVAEADIALHLQLAQTFTIDENDPNVLWFEDASSQLSSGSSPLLEAVMAIEAELRGEAGNATSNLRKLDEAQNSYQQLSTLLKDRLVEIDGFNREKAEWDLARIDGLADYAHLLRTMYSGTRWVNADWYITLDFLAPIFIALALAISIAKVSASLIVPTGSTR